MTPTICSASSDSRRAAVGPQAVAFLRWGAGRAREGHDAHTKRSVARSLAELLDVSFVGDVDPAGPPASSTLLVPSDTIESLAEARRLGIERAEDVFGGVVPHPFVASKVITHPLVRASAFAPAGWSRGFGAAVRQVVLPGYSVFSPGDALLGAERLLADGSVRVKEPGAVGGSGQYVVEDMATMRARVEGIDPEVLRREGLVLERNLHDVTTHSVGQVQVGIWRVSYFGTQHLTRNHHGHDVYGGSRLTVVRGDYDALLALAIAPAQRLAVEQALHYHRSAMARFTGLIASRSNYDIAQGRDDRQNQRSGVLEQSWRIGGASGAEAAALHAFRDDPALRLVRASTHEIYGDEVSVPAGARVHFDGVDPQAGRLTKYAMVEAHGDT